MHRTLDVGTCALLVFLMLPAHAQADGGLVLSEVLPDPDGAREFVELWNTGDAPVALAGWQVADDADQRYTFGDVSLAPGARIVVWGGGVDDGSGVAWNRASVWNNGGDTARLFDPAGSEVDNVTYTGSTPGRAWALVDGAWVDADPSPGTATGAEGGSLSVTVADVPPTVVLQAPAVVRAGAPFTVAFTVDDPNGDAVDWELTVDGAVHVSGAGSGARSAELTAAATVRVAVHATDGNHTASAEATVEVRAADVAVSGGAVAFPPLSPGDADVQSLAAFTVHNLADAARVPVLDVSPFRAGAFAIPVDGNLQVGIDAGEGIAWLPYEGPLTPLPELAPGAAVDVWLRIQSVPSPLPAGSYGTSFTVVA